MIELDKRFPQYAWKKNKGYPTKYHINTVKEIGITEFHRKTFCDSYKYEQTIIFEK
jgi:ribonuclease HII